MAKGTTLRERVAALEVSVVTLRDSIDDLRQSFRQNSSTIYQKLDRLETRISELMNVVGTISGQLDPSSASSRKEKIALWVAFISGVSSIIIAVINNLHSFLAFL